MSRNFFGSTYSGKNSQATPSGVRLQGYRDSIASLLNRRAEALYCL